MAETEAKAAPDWNACLKRIRDAHDQSSFIALFRHFAPRVKTYLIRCGGTPDQAEDAMQEAMAAVWRKADLFDPSKASASTWIFRIARNKQLDAIRKLQRPEPEDLPWAGIEEFDPAEEVGLAQEQERLRKAVKSLPPKQLEMVERAFYGELSHSEIADLTSLPLGTIKSRIRLALQRLRHELNSDHR